MDDDDDGDDDDDDDDTADDDDDGDWINIGWHIQVGNTENSWDIYLNWNVIKSVLDCNKCALWC